MADIGFYHLTRTTAEAALPPLLARTLALAQRAVIRGGDAARLAALDKALWDCRDPDWLPHGMVHPHLQPILLTLADPGIDGAPNGAAYLFLTDGTSTAGLDRFVRVFDLFDGNDAAAVAAARDRWSAAKGAGHALTYWQQGSDGWSRKG